MEEVTVGDWILSLDGEDDNKHVWGRVKGVYNKGALGMYVRIITIYEPHVGYDQQSYPVYLWEPYEPTERELVQWMLLRMKE